VRIAARATASALPLAAGPLHLARAGACVCTESVYVLRSTGRERLIHQDHRLLPLEATFEETLEIVRQLRAKQVYLTPIEEMDQIGFDELQELESRLQGDGLPNSFAYDTLIVDV
jgi:hypothetical protein